MSLFHVFPVFLGVLAVIQAAINRRIATHWGLASAVVTNNLVILTLGLIFFGVVRLAPQAFPELIRVKGGWESFSLWFLIPGICGFALVSGIPLAFHRIGALEVFVLVISSQILTSILWDRWVEGHPVTWSRAGGALLVVLGAALVAFKKS